MKIDVTIEDRGFRYRAEGKNGLVFFEAQNGEWKIRLKMSSDQCKSLGQVLVDAAEAAGPLNGSWRDAVGCCAPRDEAEKAKTMSKPESYRCATCGKGIVGKPQWVAAISRRKFCEHCGPKHAFSVSHQLPENVLEIRGCLAIPHCPRR